MAAKLHPVRHDYRAKLWCGIAALATVTGRPTSECRAAIIATRGRSYSEVPQRVTGIYNGELRGAFALLGYEMAQIADYNITPMLRRPTLAQWLKTREHVSETVVINVTGHYLTVCGRRIIDNSERCKDGPVTLKAIRCRRSRVVKAWVVRKATRAATWTPPAKPVRVPNTARAKCMALVKAFPDITVDDSDWRSMAQVWVYCAKLEATGEDAYEEAGHCAEDWDEALERAQTYAGILQS